MRGFSRWWAGSVILGAGILISSTPSSWGQSVGSFVEGERALYLEMDQFQEGQTTTLEVKNLSPDTRAVALLWSSEVNPRDVSGNGIPGNLGPDLESGGLIILQSSQLQVTPEATTNGATLYLQALAVENSGKARLSSMLEVTQVPASGNPDPETTRFPIPLTTQEILPDNKPGWNRSNGPVRVGIPFPQGEIANAGGVPQLGLNGPASEGQFSTLATWPDGSVKWALVEYLTDLNAGQSHQQVEVKRGGGNFGGSNLAVQSGNSIVVNTGPLSMVLDGSSANLFDLLQVDGKKALRTTDENRFHLIGPGNVEWTFHPQGATIRRNGPVRAEVQLDGMFTRTTSASDPDRVYLRVLVEAFREDSAVRVQTSLRNSSIQYPENLQFRGFYWSGKLKTDGTLSVRAPRIAQNGAPQGWVQDTLNSNESASLYQGFARHTEYPTTDDANGSNYTPFIERLGSNDFAIEGTRVRIAGVDHTGSAATDGFSEETFFADPAYLETWSASDGLGALISVEHAAATWPIELLVLGSGTVGVMLFPIKGGADAYDYPLTWGTSETRTFVVKPVSQRAADPRATMAVFDYPLAARAPLWAYNQSDAWPWKLVTPTQFNTFADATGLDHPSQPPLDPWRTIYRFANGTGGSNNRWGSTVTFHRWLRTGDSAGYLRSWYEAFYKVDKMPMTIDDGDARDAPPVRDETTATKRGKFYDGSKHTFLQSVPDIGFTRGETYLLDSQDHFAETFLDSSLTSTQPDGNFVNGTYGAISSSTAAVLELGSHSELEANLREYMEQWVHLVFQQPNSLGVDTETKGWQAGPDAPVGSALNPDAYFVTRAAGKAEDWEDYGYTVQIWTDSRLGALGYHTVQHYLESKDPNDPLIEDLGRRADDFYHFARRAALDDYFSGTGEYFNIDVFAGDGLGINVDPFGLPGSEISNAQPTSYVLHPWINFRLRQGPSKSAFSYGVELCRSMSTSQWDRQNSDPSLGHFVWTYLTEHGLLAED